MLRPIFIACGTPFCKGVRTQNSGTLVGFFDVGIVCANHPASDVAGKIFQMTSSSESRYGMSDRIDFGGGARAVFQRENGLSSNGVVFCEGGQLFERQAVVGPSHPHMGKLMTGRGYDFCADYVGPLVFSRQWAGRTSAHLGESDNLYNSSCITNTAMYTTSLVNGLLLSSANIFGNQASSTGGAGFAKDHQYTVGACYQNGPAAAAAPYLEVNQPTTAGDMAGCNESGTGAGDYVNLRNIFSNPVIRQKALASGANYTRRPRMAGLAHSPVDFSHADYTSFRLPICEARSRYVFAAEFPVGLELTNTDGYADGGNSLGKSAVRNPSSQINPGRHRRLSKYTSFHGISSRAKLSWRYDTSRYLQHEQFPRSMGSSRSGVALGMRSRMQLSPVSQPAKCRSV